MENELDNLVVAHLREIHAELQGITAKLEEHDGRFDRIEKRVDGSYQMVSHTLSVATLSQLKTRALETRHDTSEAWQRRMEERLDGLERRLTKVEEKLDH